MQLPSDKELRSKLVGYLQEASRELTIIDSAKEQIKEIKLDMKDKLNISGTEAGKLIAAWYDESKAKKDFETAEDVLHAIEILSGKKLDT